MQMADVEGLVEAFAPSVVILPQPSPFESSSTRGTNHAAHTLCASHRAILHHATTILPMISAVTRLEEMHSVPLCLHLLCTYYLIASSFSFVLNFFLQCAYLEALHILFFNTNFHSRIRIARYQELCMDICQIISHTNINT